MKLADLYEVESPFGTDKFWARWWDRHREFRAYDNVDVDRELLTTLKGSPIECNDFNCSRNQLTSLEGAPKVVRRDFTCSRNKLTTLEHAPATVGHDFDCTYNKLTTLKDVHKIIKKLYGVLYVFGNPIKSHILGVLYIEGCREIMLAVAPLASPKRNINQEKYKVQTIMNKHLPNKLGHKGMLACQSELLDAGFDAFAQL